MTPSAHRPARVRVITPSLLARDLEAAIRFYVDELGFTLESAWPADNPAFCILDHGDAHLMFGTESWDGHGGPALSGQLHIDLDGGVQALFERLSARHPVLWGPKVYGYGRREFSIRDPNGYRLVFSELTDDPPTCEGD